jgi:hypothetical protein
MFYIGETGRQQLNIVQASKSEVMVIQTNVNSGSRLIIMLNLRGIITYKGWQCNCHGQIDTTFWDVDSLEKLVSNIPSHS